MQPLTALGHSFDVNNMDKVGEGSGE